MLKVALYLILVLFGAHLFMTARRRWVAGAGASLALVVALSPYVTDWWIR